MSYPIILKYSDGQYNTTKLMKESELNKVLSEYPGMFLDKELGMWLWQDEGKTMMLKVEMYDENDDAIEVIEKEGGDRLLDNICLGYYFQIWTWKRTASERAMYQKALEIAFCLREKMDLDVIDQTTGEYLFPDREGSLLKELQARAKRVPKRRKWLRRNEQAGRSSSI